MRECFNTQRGAKFCEAGTMSTEREIAFNLGIRTMVGNAFQSLFYPHVFVLDQEFLASTNYNKCTIVCKSFDHYDARLAQIVTLTSLIHHVGSTWVAMLPRPGELGHNNTVLKGSTMFGFV